MLDVPEDVQSLQASFEWFAGNCVEMLLHSPHFTAAIEGKNCVTCDAENKMFNDGQSICIRPQCALLDGYAVTGLHRMLGGHLLIIWPPIFSQLQGGRYQHTRLCSYKLLRFKVFENAMNKHVFSTPHLYACDPACVKVDLCKDNTQTHKNSGTQSNDHKNQKRRGVCSFHLRWAGGWRHMHARTSHVSSALIRPTSAYMVHPKAVHRRSTIR